MAARKLQQEVDKCFKKVAEGVAEFEGIYEKIEQSNNPAQKEKLEDNLKREIKKLQRLRDQIKTWAASNDIKDKAPLLEQRRLIETQMEKFKAVEKAMKTKAYSKEGLSAAAKLDPKEQAKVEAGEFLSNMVDDLEQQIEALEAEQESIQATMKKGKSHGPKADRIAETERIMERHKWHQGKLELIRRSLENGGVETDQVTDLEDSIRYYVSEGMNADFVEDEEMYDELDLVEDEGAFGMGGENDKSSSQDGQSEQGDTVPEPEPAKAIPKKPTKEPEAPAARKASIQTKSPLPALATLHTPLPTIGNGPATNSSMKPASLPTRPAGEGLKYASAAAAAATSDKSNVGIAPLPPPQATGSSSNVGISPLPPLQGKASAASSPAISSAQPVAPLATQPTIAHQKGVDAKPPTPAVASASPAITSAAASTSLPDSDTISSRNVRRSKAIGKQAPSVSEGSESSPRPTTAQVNGTAANGIRPIEEEQQDEESIYHLPSSLSDLVDSYEASRRQEPQPSSQSTLRMMLTSQASVPDLTDADSPRHYRPDVPVAPTGSGFPRDPLPIFDDPRLYSRIDPDTLFYVFYYKQGTAQQYLAAKALKDQSWRFHKQYQTWFQRHEEPTNITEEFEQGTYRFFDYESTWMNRRKADFRFAYKFLEDEI